MSASESALRALLARFGARVRAQIARHDLGRHGIDAADVEQEVNIRLWQTLERDPNAALPASYIQKTVMSVRIDAVRRAEARPADPMPEGHEEHWESDAPSPAARASEAHWAGVLRGLIADLPERRQRPLKLYLQGFTVPEVADLCGLTFDAARKLVYRGLDEVKSHLRAQGWESDGHE